MLSAVLCHRYWFIIYPVIHIFKDQVLDTNTIDFGWVFIALYTLTRVLATLDLFSYG